ncbi:hypothetical protein V8E51_000040 [Hyaloscypha variabilis]
MPPSTPITSSLSPHGEGVLQVKTHPTDPLEMIQCVMIAVIGLVDYAFGFIHQQFQIIVIVKASDGEEEEKLIFRIIVVLEAATATAKDELVLVIDLSFQKILNSPTNITSAVVERVCRYNGK